jgi:pimeloyl-ACP methyl ester carboxylesterase
MTGRWLVRIAKGLGLLAAALALTLGVWSLVPPGTRAIPGEHAIAELRRIELGGFPQTVLLRGADRRNRVLLYVHGGPGSAQLPVARLYSGELEQHFVVAHWDQRGAGASCAGVDWSTLSLERIVADAIELAEELGRGEQIFLLGHSWGSLVGALAVQRRPDLFRAYVGLGQLVERDAQERISYDWVVEQARHAGDAEALAELATIHPPYTTQAEFRLQRRWLGRYHGEIFATDRAREAWPAAIFGREYTLATRLRYVGCFQRSLEVLLPDRLHVDLLTGIPRLGVPVFLFAGRHDYNTPFALVERWAARLQAPHVELVWFEGAAHMIPIEAPEEFQTRLVEKLLPLAERAAR